MLSKSVYRQRMILKVITNFFELARLTSNFMHSATGLTISTDQQLSCKAAHRITFTLAQPEGVKPLTLCFPHPVLVDGIDATLRRSARSIRVVLKKALNGGPCHFTKQTEPQKEKISLQEKHDVLPSANVCGGCNEKSSSIIKLKRCSRCKAVHYCSLKCQQADWKNHKLICS